MIEFFLYVRLWNNANNDDTGTETIQGKKNSLVVRLTDVDRWRGGSNRLNQVVIIMLCTARTSYFGYFVEGQSIREEVCNAELYCISIFTHILQILELRGNNCSGERLLEVEDVAYRGNILGL